MTEKTKEVKEESKVESNVTYDDRRKVMTHNTTEKRSGDLGSLEITTKGIFPEKGIRKIVKDLNTKISILQKNVKTFKDAIKEGAELEKDKDLMKFKILVEKLGALKEYEKNKAQLNDAEEGLKKAKKDLSEIKNTIGTRLKF